MRKWKTQLNTPREARSLNRDKNSRRFPEGSWSSQLALTRKLFVFSYCSRVRLAEERIAAEAVNGNLFAIINILAVVKFDII